MANYVSRAGNKFAAEVGEWVVSTKDYTRQVMRESIRELVYQLQATCPHETGFLRASLMTSTTSLPPPDWIRPDRHRTYNWDNSSFEHIVGSIKVGDKIYISYLAYYFPYLEYGTADIAARGWVRLGIQRWPSIVDQVVARLRTVKR